MPRAQRFIPPIKFTRSAVVDSDWWEQSALWHLRFLAEQLEVEDLSGSSVLDVGCGVKLTTAILNHDVPVARYVGLDIYEEMIDFLRENVSDERLAYHHVPFENALYNPDGIPLTADYALPVEESAFDLVCLFSVFTHLNPDDYQTMLRLLRRYVAPTGRLLFSLYINEETPGGHGYVDSLARLLRERPELAENRRRDTPPEAVPPFVDVVPDKPLLIALYSREFAEELVRETGWKIVRVNQPQEFIQHSILCAPA